MREMHTIKVYVYNTIIIHTQVYEYNIENHEEFVWHNLICMHCSTIVLYAEANDMQILKINDIFVHFESDMNDVHGCCFENELL